MRKLLKLFVSFLVLASFIFINIVPSYAEDVLYGIISVPSQVTKNKNFTANLQVQCNSPVSVVMFTLVFGNEVEYKSCKVNDSDNGYIEKYQDGNTLKIMYINTDGVDTTNVRTLVDVTFKAGNNVSDTSFEVYTDYSTNSNEQSLTDTTGTIYDFQIVEKASSSVSSANGRTVSNSSSSQSNSSKSSNNEAIPEREKSTVDNTEDTPTDSTTGNNNVVNVLNSDNNILIFIAGGSFALALGAVVFISYNAGKKRLKSKKDKQ